VTKRPPSYRDRFTRIADAGKRLPASAELAELATFCSDWQGMANELETAAADFEANVEMLADPDTARDEHNALRDNLRAAADRLASVFDELAHFTEGLPAIRQGAKQDCFKNAIHVTAWGGVPGTIYVEGYATGTIPTLHAWVTDAAGELAYDPTWEDDYGREYFGVAFDPSWASMTMVDTGVYGIFGGENQELILGLLKNGIPDEALAFR